MAQVYNPTTWETAAGGRQVQGQFKQLNKTLSQNKKIWGYGSHQGEHEALGVIQLQPKTSKVWWLNLPLGISVRGKVDNAHRAPAVLSIPTENFCLPLPVCPPDSSVHSQF